MKQRQMLASWLAAALLLLGAWCAKGQPLFEMGVLRLVVSALMALGLYYSTVYGGLLSLGQGGFMAIGAYSAALLLRQGFPFLLCLVLSLLSCALTAFLVGFAVLGLKGDYLAMTTMALGEIIKALLLRSPGLGGASGIYGIPVCLDGVEGAALLLAAVVFLTLFCRSPFSLRLRAVKNDQVAASSLGIPPRILKTAAFSLSAAFSGLAGVVFAAGCGFVTPGDFTFLRSMDAVTAVVLGGLSSPLGCLGAAWAVELSGMLLQSLSWLRMVLYGLGLVLCIRLFHGRRGQLGSSAL